MIGSTSYDRLASYDWQSATTEFTIGQTLKTGSFLGIDTDNSVSPWINVLENNDSV